MLENIYIKNIAEIAVGSKINGETIISKKSSLIETVGEGIFKPDESSSISVTTQRKCDYVLMGNTLIKTGLIYVSEKDYKKYLNQIKQTTN